MTTSTLSPVDSIRELIASDFDAVNALLTANIQSECGLIDNLAQHIVNSGGKRLRPLLVILSTKASQYVGEQHIPLAAMIECFHTATLLHDDVVDESTLRRGKTTAHHIWGSKASILVGDYLFTKAMQLMIQVNHTKILNLLSRTAHEISFGEIKQLEHRYDIHIQPEHYLDIIRSKTALLFAACAAIGPLLADCDTEVENNLYAYGLHLGNTFQIIDDVLDYTSDKTTLGKNIGDDLVDGKITLPLLYALERSNAEDKGRLFSAIQSANIEALPVVLECIEKTNAVALARDFARAEYDKAMSCLHVLPDSQYKQALSTLADFALTRTF